MAEIDEGELARRHRAASRVVQGLITASLLLVVLAYAGVRLPLRDALFSPSMYGAIWIVILCFGLGAIALRRARSAAMRLQDVADLGGPGALWASLQKTTLLIAALGGAIALLGYVVASVWREPWDMLKACVIALAVLLYAYPRREAWRRAAEASQRPGGLTARPPAKGTTA
jgi:hypothetical protein